MDTILAGGLTRGDLYLVAGPPGSGKTTLGNQIAFTRAAAGAVAIYATVLAETHERMLEHLAGFSFFERARVASGVHYVSLYDELVDEGLPGALTLLRRLVREHRASLLVVDGASLFDDFAPTPVDFRRFTSELHAQLAAMGCSTVLLADDDGLTTGTVGYQVDGIVALENDEAGMRDVRLLRVVKLRGANPMRGHHQFGIGRDGLTILPRLESLVSRAAPPPAVPAGHGQQGFGIPGFDRLLGGGLPAASTTLLLGESGTGKTCVGLHFIAEGARRGEPGLIASLDETEAQLTAKASALGLDLAGAVAAGDVHVRWHFPLEWSLDAWAQGLLDAVDETGARRVFVDPAGAFQEMNLFPDRLSSFLTALVYSLRRRGVGAIFAAESPTVVATGVEMPPLSFPVTVDNAILLRFVEIRSQLRRLASVLKVRSGPHETSLYEFTIGPNGIEVAPTFESAEAVLSGAPQRTLDPPEQPGEPAGGNG